MSCLLPLSFLTLLGLLKPLGYEAYCRLTSPGMLTNLLVDNNGPRESFCTLFVKCLLCAWCHVRHLEHINLLNS